MYNKTSTIAYVHEIFLTNGFISWLLALILEKLLIKIM